MKYAPLAALALLASATATLADETRSAEKHEHGHGAFQMVIEDHRIVIELEVPAHDIVGFEHAPSTAQQRSALAEAAAALGRPDVLFGIPEAAECAIGQVEIGFGATGGHRHEHGGEDAHEDDDHDHDDHAAEGHDHDHGHEGDAAHSEVTAYYSLACARPEALDRLGFAYFEAFAGADELEVVVLSPSGQSAGEVSRNETVFEIE